MSSDSPYTAITSLALRHNWGQGEKDRGQVSQQTRETHLSPEQKEWLTESHTLALLLWVARGSESWWLASLFR